MANLKQHFFAIIIATIPFTSFANGWYGAAESIGGGMQEAGRMMMESGQQQQEMRRQHEMQMEMDQRRHEQEMQRIRLQHELANQRPQIQHQELQPQENQFATSIKPGTWNAENEHRIAEANPDWRLIINSEKFENWFTMQDIFVKNSFRSSIAGDIIFVIDKFKRDTN